MLGYLLTLLLSVLSPMPNVMFVQDKPMDRNIHMTTDSIPDVPVMSFENRLIDLGKVMQGEKRTFYFEFTNEGKVPLTIEFISSCECTETEYNTESVEPGDSDRIKVIFDSESKKASETISIDILLKEMDPLTGAPIIETVEYRFEM